MLPLATRFQVRRTGSPGIFKVVTLAEAASGNWPLARCLLELTPEVQREPNLAQLASRVAGVLTSANLPDAGFPGWWLTEPDQSDVVRSGDVVSLAPGRALVRVLWRRGANANSLFATGRCNSLCLMCSQPPTTADDNWRLAELLQTIALIDRDELQLGVTGGEPTLLDGLPVVIAACRDRLPQTRLHILTNGRRFADQALAERLASLRHPDLVWAVPLYGDLPELHDWVVQAKGAFAETLQGLYHLALWRQRVEIRVVLHKPTVERLPELAAFITRMLPFAQHVAFMGLEPIGFARLHQDLLWIDPEDYAVPLSQACWHMANRGMSVSIYNLPLCVLPPELRRFARQSISDWKNDFVAACAPCVVRGSCAGFFTSASAGWHSRAIHPLTAHEAGLAIASGAGA